MTISLCMLISRERLEPIRFACTSARRHWEFDEILLGVSSKISEDTLEKIKRFFHTKKPIRIFPGADTREEVARARFNLFDNAKCDWIMNVDDDDGILGNFDLGAIAENHRVGFIHTGILAVYMEKVTDRPTQPGDLLIRELKAVERPEDADGFRGSHYVYRREAWQQVSPIVDREETAYEEWRVVWHMRHMGWQGHLIDKVLQIQRVRDWTVAAKHQREVRKFVWTDVVKELEEKFGSGVEDRPEEEPEAVESRDANKRDWQLWDDESKRSNVEKFWHKDQEQVARREQFNNILGNLAKRGKFDSVLDFSCGTCEDYPYLSSLGLRYRGVDVTPGMLEMAREKYPIVDVSLDDIFSSKFADREHPWVVNSAVLPHLPLEPTKDNPEACVPQAIRELWRITGGCLTVRLFAVDRYPEDDTRRLNGFIYNSLRQRTWLDLFKANLSPGGRPATVEIVRGHSGPTEDIMEVVAWR